MAKSKLRLEARELRRKGFGIKTIAQKLNVSSSTASLWCRDIILTPEQIEQLSHNARDPYFGRRKDHIEKIKLLRKRKIEKLMRMGRQDIANLNKREFFAAGIALYWAEGFKKDKQVGFSNSDSEMISFFLKWLKSYCGITTDQIKLRIGVNEIYEKKTPVIEKYWSDYLKIPLQQFHKPYIQKVKWKKLYENPDDYHGVLRIRVTKSGDLLHKIRGWIEGIKLNEF